MDYLKELADRDTALTAATVLPAAYTWIFLESVVVAASVACVSFVAAVASHDALARRFGWTRHEIAVFSEPYIDGFLRMIRSRIQRA